MEESLKDILTARLRKDEMVAFLKKHPNKFEEVLNTALTDNQPEAWRAAWLLNHYMKENDQRVKLQIKKIIKVIPTKQDGHQRELLKILNKMELSEKQQGKLFDICLTIWESIHKSPSVRGTAFMFLLKISKKYPELRNEIVHLTQNHYTDTLSPGIKHSFNKIIEGL
ncbi:MAG: hypothetical protein ABFS12_00505 [Bacteroidota bacterium]